MPRTLDVYLHRHLVGHLIQDEHGQMKFSYAELWLSDPAAMPLSLGYRIVSRDVKRV